jgi:hypothetical protein
VNRVTKILGVGLLLIGAGLTCAEAVGRQLPEQEPAKVLSSVAIEGRVLGLCLGDYWHVVIQPRIGRPKTYFVWGNTPEYLDYFLALHQGASTRARYEVTDTYIPEARGRQVIEVLVDATVGRTSYKEWYAKEGHLLGRQDPERVERFKTSRLIDCSEGALQMNPAEPQPAADRRR